MHSLFFRECIPEKCIDHGYNFHELCFCSRVMIIEDFQTQCFLSSEMLQSKVQALQMLFRKAKRRRGLGGKYTRLTSIDEQDSEDELFTQPV